MKDAVNRLFSQVVTILVDMGQITLEEQYVDGTKIESVANKYTFVWKKTVEKNKAREMLTSEEGLRHRSRRPIEPEAVFGQIKSDWHYRRFRHRGKDKVYMDFAILAMAHNLRKFMRKAQNEPMDRVLAYLLRLCEPDWPHKALFEPDSRIYRIVA